MKDIKSFRLLIQGIAAARLSKLRDISLCMMGRRRCKDRCVSVVRINKVTRKSCVETGPTSMVTSLIVGVGKAEDPLMKLSLNLGSVEWQPEYRTGRAGSLALQRARGHSLLITHFKPRKAE